MLTLALRKTLAASGTNLSLYKLLDSIFYATLGFSFMRQASHLQHLPSYADGVCVPAVIYWPLNHPFSTINKDADHDYQGLAAY